MSDGSSVNGQISWKALCASRFFRTIATGPSGSGKRSDSWRACGSSPAPRRWSPTRRRSTRSRASRSDRVLAGSTTSKRYLPRSVRSSRLRRVAGPLERLDDDAVEAEALVRGIAGVVVVHAHRSRRGGGRGRHGEHSKRGEDEGNAADHLKVRPHGRARGAPCPPSFRNRVLGVDARRWSATRPGYGGSPGSGEDRARRRVLEEVRLAAEDRPVAGRRRARRPRCQRARARAARSRSAAAAQSRRARSGQSRRRRSSTCCRSSRCRRARDLSPRHARQEEPRVEAACRAAA